MKVIPPAAVNDATLLSSNAAETDYPEWSATAVYGAGDRVIRAATHRIYESAASGNVGNNPASGSSIAWTNVGPTNRWAMFDQAVGSTTVVPGSITVAIAPDQPVDALAVLDTNATSVHVVVQAGGATVSDHTQAMPAGATTLTFLDLPPVAGATVTMTATAGGQPVSIGTLIIGAQIDLGTTETTPQIGITDYSKRDTDDYGVTTVVERSWAKRMTLRTQIDTTLVDSIQRKIADVRAKACLWLGDDGFDSLAVYGFFKDFSVDLSLPSVSYCSFTIEGLTTAGIYDNPIADVQVDVDAVAAAQAAEQLRASLYRTDTDNIIKNPDGTTIRETVDQLGIDNGDTKSFVEDLKDVSSSGSVKAVRTLNAKGYVSGNYQLNDGTFAKDYIIADAWGVIDPAHANDPDAEATSPFRYIDDVLYVDHAYIRLLETDTASVHSGADSTSAFQGQWTAKTGTPGPRRTMLSTSLTMKAPGWINIFCNWHHAYGSGALPFLFVGSIFVNGVEQSQSFRAGGSVYGENESTQCRYYAAAAGNYTIDAGWEGDTAISVIGRSLIADGYPFTEQ